MHGFRYQSLTSGPKHDRKNDVKRDDGDEDEDEDKEDKDEEGIEDGDSSEKLEYSSDDSSPETDEPRRKPDFDLLKDMEDR